MQILSTGGTMSAIEEQPETIVATSQCPLGQSKQPAHPDGHPLGRLCAEKVMLRFKDELKRLSLTSKGGSLSAERACLTGQNSILCRSKAGSTISRRTRMLTRLPKGPTRDEWIASRVLYLSALCPWRYTQGIFRFAPSFAKALCSSSLKGDIPVKSSFACRNGRSTSRRQRPGMTTPFLSGSGRISEQGHHDGKASAQALAQHGQRNGRELSFLHRHPT